MIQQVNNDDQTFIIILIMTLNIFLIKTSPIYYSVHRTTTVNVFFFLLHRKQQNLRKKLWVAIKMRCEILNLKTDKKAIIRAKDTGCMGIMQ